MKILKDIGLLLASFAILFIALSALSLALLLVYLLLIAMPFGVEPLNLHQAYSIVLTVLIILAIRSGFNSEEE